MPRDSSLGFQAQESDAAFANCISMAVAGDERVAAIRTGNEKCGRLVEEVDFEMAQARYRILSKQGDLANLANALKSHLPSIAADARQISVSADLLKENFVALESRMFNLLLAKAIAEQETWSKQQHQMANEYVAAKSSLEVQAEGDPIVAQKLLAYEEEGSQGRDASSSAGGAASSAASFLQGAATAIFSGNAGSAAAAAGATSSFTSGNKTLHRNSILPQRIISAA